MLHPFIGGPACGVFAQQSFDDMKRTVNPSGDTRRRDDLAGINESLGFHDFLEIGIRL